MSIEKAKINAPVLPGWLSKIIDAGFIPYIATSKRLLPTLNTTPFGLNPHCFTLEDPAHTPFHEAYLLSNSLGFKSPDLKMPNWVLIDCALMQTAIIGFMKPKTAVPEILLNYYQNDPSVDTDNLDYIPISGQIASPAADRESLSGFSLFSLSGMMDGPKNLGLYTKALALEVYRASGYKWLFGIAQYNNPAIRIHGRFSSRMEISQPIVPLHPKKHMTFIYKMSPDYDPLTLDQEPVGGEPTFWLNANDEETKRRMQNGVNNGKRYIITYPYSITHGEDILLPIIEENAETY